jgi:hypothetical protein
MVDWHALRDAERPCHFRTVEKIMTDSKPFQRVLSSVYESF